MRLFNYITWFYFWQELKSYTQIQGLPTGFSKSQQYVGSNLRTPNVPMAYIAMDLLGEYSEMT